ncbi:HAD-IIA family hydrolase [Aphanothece stagnina]|uniref:HAD-IIA family hydrolase n=1 Tax=Aphanothece stagnina TaxID=1004305 RepID=UPI00398F0484
MTPTHPAAPVTLTVDAVFARYEAIRPHLPAARRPGAAPVTVGGLLDMAGRVDGFLFDSFGVLNVGESVIPGAAECLSALRHRGTPFCVLTNAASYPRSEALRRYRRMGLDIREAEVVSSRDVAFAQAGSVAPGITWAAMSAGDDGFADSAVPVRDLLDDSRPWAAAEGFLFLSAARWTPALQDRLVDELRRRPRPVIIANPDLAAPREGGLSVEPGFWGHDLQDRTGISPRFFGKPYAAAFAAGLDRLGPGRHAMVGDTLHTDILGGQSAGCATVLVTDHGVLAGRQASGFIARSGILPDWIVPSI